MVLYKCKNHGIVRHQKRNMRGSSIKESPVLVKLLLKTLLCVMIILMMMNNHIQLAYGDISPTGCRQQRKGLENSCKPVIFGFKPSADCCAKVRGANFECICPYVTPKLISLIGLQRAIKGIEGCGRPVPHHFKCGSVTTP
ncbi:hypothetical protein Leryth_001630 [Lithospermum erythrorhizon]|nr:hypothetical protein Leryth_001630 [Lithospermum erythrorhizon]